MPEFTKTQLEQQKRDLQKLVDDPRVPDSRRELYVSTIAKIDARLAVVGEPERAAEQRPAAPHHQPAENRPQPRQDAASEPLRAERLRSAPIPQPVYESAPTTETTAPVTATTEPDGEVEAGPTEREKRIIIRWSDGNTQRVTEGYARGRLDTYLTELAESRLAKQERFEQMPERYDTFGRAVVYYRVLCTFWQRPVKPVDLKLTNLGAARKRVWDLIVEHANV
jgi:hypothetical protein